MRYICAYCGNVYQTIEERTQCEEKCHNAEILESKKKEADRRKEDMHKDYDELKRLEEARDRLEKQVREKRTDFCEKYDTFEDTGFYTFLNDTFRNPFLEVRF